MLEGINIILNKTTEQQTHLFINKIKLPVKTATFAIIITLYLLSIVCVCV